MTLVCLLTGCPSPGTYFSLLGLLSPLFCVFGCLSNRCFHWTFIPSACLSSYMWLLLLFDLSPPGLESIVCLWLRPVSYRTRLSFSEEEFMIYLYKNRPYSILSKPSTFLFSIAVAGTGPGILEVLNKYSMEWVSELFPLDITIWSSSLTFFYVIQATVILVTIAQPQSRAQPFPLLQSLPLWPPASNLPTSACLSPQEPPFLTIRGFLVKHFFMSFRVCCHL